MADHRLSNDRTWITAFTVAVIALWLVAVFSGREYALFKSTLRDHFAVQHEFTDRDIVLVKNQAILSLFGLYSAFLIGFVPLALQRLFRRVTLAMLLVFLLFVPCLWYGTHVFHVAGKLVDWGAVL